MKNYFLLLILSCFLSLDSFGQNDSIPNTQAVDSITNLLQGNLTSVSKSKKGNFVSRYFKDDYPSPRKAVILTAILPGLGQIYNKKYWYIKLPIIYGAFGGLIYAIDFNGRQYRFFRDEHKFLVDGDPMTMSVFEGRVSAAVLMSERDRFDKFLQTSYIGIGLAYILTAAEAYTTAHLLSFDINDDLGLQLKPSFDYVPNQGTVVGFGIKIKLKNGKKSYNPKDIFNSN